MLNIRSINFFMLRLAKRLLSTRRFTADHEWVSVSDGIATMGITDYAQKALGDVVYIEVPQVGQQVQQKDPVGAVESVKAASDIYAPISGTVHSTNSLLADKPSLINSSPFQDGWIAKLKIDKMDEFNALMDQAEYDKFTQ